MCTYTYCNVYQEYLLLLPNATHPDANGRCQAAQHISQHDAEGQRRPERREEAGQRHQPGRRLANLVLPEVAEAGRRDLPGGVEAAEHGEGVGREDAEAAEYRRGGEEGCGGIGEGRDARREGQDAAADAGLDEVEGRGREGGLVIVVGSGGSSGGGSGAAATAKGHGGIPTPAVLGGDSGGRGVDGEAGRSCRRGGQGEADGEAREVHGASSDRK